MTATFQDVQVYSTSNPGTPFSTSHTVTTGDDQKLIVVIVAEGGALSSLATPTYNSVSMTQVDFQAGGSDGICIALYYLDSPPAGAHTLAVDLSAGTPSRAALRVFTACGLAAGGATAFNGSGLTSTSTTTVSVASVPENNVVIDGAAGNLHTTTSMSTTESGQTDIASGPITIGADGVVFGVSSRPAATTGTYAMSWSFTSSQTRTAQTAASFELADAPPSWSMTTNEVTASRIHQRVGTTAPVALSGTYSGGTPTSIEAQIVLASDGTTVVQAWTALTSTSISGGNWSGSLSAPEDDVFYKVQVRLKESGSVVVTGSVSTNQWGVGDLYLCIGSSTAQRWFVDGTYSAEAKSRRVRVGGTTWATFTAGAAVDFATVMAAARGVLVGMLDCGLGGTYLNVDWADDTDAVWTDTVTLLNAVGNKVAGVMCHVGSNDARNDTIVNKADHLAKYRLLISNVRTATGVANVPFFVWGCQRASTGTNANWDIAREVEAELAGDTGVYLGTTVVDLALAGDGVHLSDAAMLAAMGRMEQAFLDVLGSETYHRGPAVTSMQWSADYCDVNIQHYGGTDFTPTSAITGFVFSDGSGALTISSAVRQTATKIRVTFSRSIVAPLVGTYQSGADPTVSAAVLDNSADTLPMQPATLITPTQGGDVAITGQSITASAGSVSVSRSIELTGLSITAAIGSVGPSRGISLAGQAVTVSRGSLTSSGGDVVAGSGDYFIIARRRGRR